MDYKDIICRNKQTLFGNTARRSNINLKLG